MTIFDFFKIRLLSFCTAELKSEDIFVLRRVRAFSGYSFCWLNPQTLPPLLCDCVLAQVPKPGKDPTKAESYRPIALASTLSEWCILLEFSLLLTISLVLSLVSLLHFAQVL